MNGVREIPSVIRKLIYAWLNLRGVHFQLVQDLQGCSGVHERPGHLRNLSLGIRTQYDDTTTANEICKGSSIPRHLDETDTNKLIISSPERLRRYTGKSGVQGILLEDRQTNSTLNHAISPPMKEVVVKSH
ncbi:hypothetical protein J6590_076290 [Homalodisca vitripennis]|nr:hypothetical protein J6590_076290 [Homalodisca vitripennis]